MSDSNDVATTLENMMSHGIFDSEVIANSFRVRGWKFVLDPEQTTENGGAYQVRSPGGLSGIVNWYGKEAINGLTENAAFFMNEEAPPHMFLAWIFADQMGRLVLGKPFDENSDGTPVLSFFSFYDAYVALNSVPHQLT